MSVLINSSLQIQCIYQQQSNYNISIIILKQLTGGEAGIRTLGGLPLNGFQDRRFRPLSHLSIPATQN